MAVKFFRASPKAARGRTQFNVGEKTRVNLRHETIEGATILAVEKRLSTSNSFGFNQTALIDVSQVVKEGV